MNSDVCPAHTFSKGGINPVLNIFKVPKTDISINDCRISTFSPMGKSITPIQFDLPAMTEFVDLSRSYFTFKLKLAMSDGAPIKTTDDPFLVNNLAHSMIKKFTVRLNGTLINPHRHLSLQSLRLNPSKLRQRGWKITSTTPRMGQRFKPPSKMGPNRYR